MLHGNPTSSLVWQGVIERVSTSYRCVAPDYPGFGRSIAGPGYGYSPGEHADVVAQLIDHLDLRDYVPVMQDWGGPIGVAAAAKDPSRVAGMAVANTWAWPVNGDPHFEIASRLMSSPLGQLAITRLNLFVNQVIPLGHRLRKPSEAEMAQYRAAMPSPKARRAAAVLPRAILEERTFLRHCEASIAHFADLPSLLVWASKDIAFREKELQRWQRLLPNSMTVRVPGAGHYLQSDAPEDVADAIMGWSARAVDPR
jgi:haloalkane dehalogenase